MTTSPRRRRLWPVVRRIWATLGITATVIFAVWSVLAYRANDEAHAALRGDANVVIAEEDRLWRFDPTGTRADVGLIFVPGALVDPVAYAPIVRSAAEAGYPSVLLRLPRRGAFGGGDDPSIPLHILAVMERREGPRRWIVAGHSRGGVITTNTAVAPPAPLVGIILIGTSHPRDVSLAASSLPITKIIGTRDGLASLEEVEANAHLLPSGTRWVRIEGGNHSQFGWYGFQPGDSRATIPAGEQRARTIDAVLTALRESALPP
jgi:pimeloyl-ACP methyl ester carboxylesterase